MSKRYNNSHVPIVEYAVDDREFVIQASQLGVKLSGLGLGDFSKDMLKLQKKYTTGLKKPFVKWVRWSKEKHKKLNGM